MTFDTIDLIKPLLSAVRAAGYTTPTPIQAQAIPPGLAGRDLCGQAQTGTGKTAAFVLPILQRLATTPGRGGIRVLVLAPTRELAGQIHETFQKLSANLPKIRSGVVFGGVSERPQQVMLRQGVDILVATPGRLLDLGGQGYVQIKNLDVLVLDEADRMLDMGFLPDVRRVLRQLPTQRQTMLFSATIPDAIEKLAKELLKDPVRISVTPEQPTVERIRQTVHFVDRSRKKALLAELLANPGVSRAVVFTRTTHGANRLAEDLAKVKIYAQAIHGNKSQKARTVALDNFKSGGIKVLVATDIAARGIDVTGISHVFNYDMPTEAETYVHRIGRTARAGADGIAISLCGPEEKTLLRDIERLLQRRIEVSA